MKKVITALTFLFIFASNKVAFAQNTNFDISSIVSYTVQSTGKTISNQSVEIKNKTDIYYVPSYTINLGFKNLSNIKVEDSDGNIPYTYKKNEDSSTIDIVFNKRIAGIDKVNKFFISYETSEIAKKVGSVWEISVPGLSNPDDFMSFEINVKTPVSLGFPTIIKPDKIFDPSSTSFNFSKKEIGKSGISMIFGSSQFYEFDLTYHLSNPNLFPIKTEIALPPDTNYQEVLINSITPPPISTYSDSDGNWLAVFSLMSNNKLNVKVSGVAKINSSPRKEPLFPKNRSVYLKDISYWNVNDSKIEAVANRLKTPYDVYTYVVDTLSYNYDKVASENTRIGASDILSNPTNAVCLEFTDLFITLTRSVGIPSRAVEGYAYTENSKLRPLSLVKDVLHAWPEYYDDQKKTWVMVDPTWGNTTHGIDYFNTLDFEHLTFVIKGVDSSYPIPAGGYKTDEDSKDVNVRFSTSSDFIPKETFEVIPKVSSFALSGFPIVGKVNIKNTGNTKIHDKKLYVISTLDSKTHEFQVDNLPPYGVKTFSVEFPKTPFLTNKKHNITIQFDKYNKNQIITVSLLPQNIYLIVGGGIVASVILITFIAIKTWRLYVQRRERENTVRW